MCGRVDKGSELSRSAGCSRTRRDEIAAVDSTTECKTKIPSLDSGDIQQ